MRKRSATTLERTRDEDIRLALRAELDEKYGADPDTVIADELGLCEHESRVDLAVVNGQFVGYEIKSDRDTLERLGGQIETYGRCLDRAILVTGASHVDAARRMLPYWWGIIVTRKKQGVVSMTTLRKGRINKSINLQSVAQMIWRTELQRLLKANGIEVDRDLDKHSLARLASKRLDRQTLCHCLRERLRTRLRLRQDGKLWPKRNSLASTLAPNDHVLMLTERTKELQARLKAKNSQPGSRISRRDDFGSI